MSDLETSPAQPPNLPLRPSREPRRFLFLSLCVAAVLVILPMAFVFWANSAATQNLARKRLIETLEQATGARVEIASFHWHLLTLEGDAAGLVLHGREAGKEAPFAQVDSLSARITIFGLFSPRILLRDLEISRPSIHLIVYADGSTNIPHPAKPQKPHKPVIDALFDLQAGHVSVQQGMLNFENRAAEFDFQNRFIPLDFDANNVSALLRYIPATGRDAETYHIEAGATDLVLTRGKEKPAIGSLQTTVDLTRDGATVRSLRLTSTFPAGKGHRAEVHALDFSGSLRNFARPEWQARTTGELDMRLLEPVFGFPFAPQGIARLNLEGAGQGSEFRTDGSVHIDDGAYIAPGIVATGVRVDSHVHADPRQLLITRIVAHLRQGGIAEGDIALTPWLPTSSAATVMERSGLNSVRAPGSVAPHRPPPPNPDVILIPVNGKVRAKFKDLPLDGLLDIVSQPPFQRLGFNALLNGTAQADWVKGDQQTLVVASTLSMATSPQAVPNEVPANGAIDATYFQRDGGVDLRKFDMHTQASEVSAAGHLGAYPLTSPSGFKVDLHSRNLGEFDQVLRDLGLTLYGKTGAAALPLHLAGQGQFQGSWTGSLVDPHLSGTAKATQVELAMLPGNSSPGPVKPAAQALSSPTGSFSSAPKFVHWDSVEATGSYSAQRIAIQHGILRKGPAQIALDGTLDATPSATHPAEPEFDEASTLHLHLNASKVDLTDLLRMSGKTLPLTGALQAQLQANGPLRSLAGAGMIELDNATVYGEPVTRIRAQGTFANQLLSIRSGTAEAPAGSLSVTGDYDLKTRDFQIDSRASGIDIAKIESLHSRDAGATGALGFSLTGSGTAEDPHLDAHATLNNLMLGGESLGALVFAGHTANHAAVYNATTRLEGARLDLNGQTSLRAEYDTQAKLEFSHFNIGGLLRDAHVQGLTGESALAGAVSVSGPLAHPVQMRGDALLQQVDATIAGVHLASQGSVHATLADGRINLDPLRITGEDTDLHAQGSLALKDQPHLDFAAGGSINLRLAETVDPDLTAGGTTTFQVEAHGTLKDPGLQGRVDFENGSLSLEDLPNGLSQLHGTLVFNQNRLEVKSLTAMSGGGLLSVGGYLAYQHGLFADLSVTGKGIRIRYPQGVSSLADTTLHLQGTQDNLLLSGDVLITRFAITQDLDITTLAAQANAVPTVASPDAPSNHIRLDVHVASSPQLNFQNAYAKLAGNVDLHLRGTLASPSLLGRVSITEGSAIIAGTRYDLQRGDIFFTNPVRIEPSIDLNATARVEDYDITLGLHGTPQKLSVTYRSDPPLPEADVVALLALGRTENQQRLYTQVQEQYVANPTTDALLGGALNATVSSRVQRLFGAGAVKVDPNYIGTLGNSTSRITVEEQVGRNLTLTYATDVDTTGQQLLQAEIAINRHVSLLVARDESGVFSMVLKATRRYR